MVSILPVMSAMTQAAYRSFQQTLLCLREPASLQGFRYCYHGCIRTGLLTDIITNPIPLTYSFLAGKMLGEKSETRATDRIHQEKKW